MNGALSDFWYWLISNILVSSKGIITLQRVVFLILFYAIQVWFLPNNEGNRDNKNYRDI